MTNIGENNKLKPELESSHCQDVKLDESHSTSKHDAPMGQNLKMCSTLTKNGPFFHWFATPNPFTQAQNHQSRASGAAPCTIPMSLCLCKFMGGCKTQICGQTVARGVMHLFKF